MNELQFVLKEAQLKWAVTGLFLSSGIAQPGHTLVPAQYVIFSSLWVTSLKILCNFSSCLRSHFLNCGFQNQTDYLRVLTSTVHRSEIVFLLIFLIPCIYIAKNTRILSFCQSFSGSSFLGQGLLDIPPVKGFWTLVAFQDCEIVYLPVLLVSKEWLYILGWVDLLCDPFWPTWLTCPFHHLTLSCFCYLQVLWDSIALMKTLMSTDSKTLLEKLLSNLTLLIFSWQLQSESWQLVLSTQRLNALMQFSASSLNWSVMFY